MPLEVVILLVVEFHIAPSVIVDVRFVAVPLTIKYVLVVKVPSEQFIIYELLVYEKRKSTTQVIGENKFDVRG